MTNSRTPLQPPSASQLATSPQLGVLAILDDALQTTTAALHAAHPDIMDWERPNWSPPADLLTRQAARIIRRARQLHEIVCGYHALAVVSSHRRELIVEHGSPADHQLRDSLCITLPRLSAEQADLLFDGFSAVARAVWGRYEKELVDLMFRRGESFAFDDRGVSNEIESEPDDEEIPF